MKIPNIVPSFLPRDTPVLIAQECSREAVFNLSGGGFTAAAKNPTRSCFCVFRESERALEVRAARLADRGVPGGCCCLGVPVLEVSFPYILALLLVPYP